MRFLPVIPLLLAVGLTACRTTQQEQPQHDLTVVEDLRVPPLEKRPPPDFERITYQVSGEGTIGRVDLIREESLPGYDVFTVVNHMPHGASVNRWHGFAGLLHLLVTTEESAPGSWRQWHSQVLAVDAWDGELFPLEAGNEFEALLTRRDILYNVRVGQSTERQNTCLLAFRVMERIEELPEQYDALEGPFYLIRQTIDCMEADIAYREIVFAPSIGCPIEIRTLDDERNVLSYRRLAHLVPAEDEQS